MSILICIFSAVFWSLFDLTRKLSLKILSPKEILILLMITQLFLFGIWTSLYPFHMEVKNYLIPGIALIFIGIISAILFLKAIQTSDLSLTIPLLSLTPLFSVIFSFFLLDEKLTIYQNFAVIFIIFGALTLYSKNLKLSSIINSIITIKRNNSARLMIIVSLSWSITPVLDKLCLKFSSINLHGLIQSLGMLIFLFLLSSSEIKKLKNVNKKKILITITLSIGIVATISQLYAISHNFVPIMESIKRIIGLVGSLIFGLVFFKEKITKPKIVGLACLSLGMFFIFW